MKKPRSDAILLNLPEEQQAKLADWLLSGMPYHEARVLVEKEFGKSVKSLSAFAEFWCAVCQPALLSRRSRALGAASVRAEAVRLNAGEFDIATLDAIKQKAYELAESPDANPKDVKSILTLVLKARDQDLEERRISLLEQKARQADEAQQVMASALTADEKAARMRQIFGMA